MFQSYQNWGLNNPQDTGPDTFVHLVSGVFEGNLFGGKWMSCAVVRGKKEFPQTCYIKECSAGEQFDDEENCIPISKYFSFRKFITLS